jgi:hypothetical protein
LPFVRLVAWKVKERVLLPVEMLSSLALPVLPDFANICGVKCMELDNISEPQLARMAGNGMSVPAVGAVMLVTACNTCFCD